MFLYKHLIMRKIFFLIVLSFTVFSYSSAYSLEKVRTYSIPFYTGFSVYVADQMGFFEKNGIETEPKWFPSGAPIVQAAAAKQWDMTFLGAPPAVLGGPKLNLKTVGMVVEEAAIHELIGRKDFVNKVKKDKSALKGAKIFVTTLSTGHFMTEECLQMMGVNQDEVKLITSEQSATVSAFAAGEGDLAQVWPPQTSALKSRGGEVLCSGDRANLSIPSVWVAHPDFAKKHPDLVVKWLKANVEAVEWMKKDPQKTYEMYKKYDVMRGFDTPDAAIRDEAKLAAGALLASDQVNMMKSKGGGKSDLVKSYEEIAKFYVRNGRLKSVPDYSGLVVPSYMEKVAK